MAAQVKHTFSDVMAAIAISPSFSQKDARATHSGQRVRFAVESFCENDSTAPCGYPFGKARSGLIFHDIAHVISVYITPRPNNRKANARHNCIQARRKNAGMLIFYIFSV